MKAGIYLGKESISVSKICKKWYKESRNNRRLFRVYFSTGGKVNAFIPAEISDREASLIEPFTVGCRAARRSQPQKGEKAIVFGCGTIGIAAAITLKYFGLDQVIIADLSDFRLNIAKKLGFETCNIANNEK